MSLQREVWFAGLLLCALFVAGLGAGIGLDRLVFTPPASTWGPPEGPPGGPPGPPPIAHFVEALDLTPEQTQKVRQIFEQTRIQADAVHQEVKPRMDALFRESEQQLRSVLNPAQQKKYDAMRKRHRRPPFAGPPAGPPGRGPPPRR